MSTLEKQNLFVIYDKYKSYEAIKCEDCQQKIKYVFVVNNEKKVCASCAAKRLATSLNINWEKLPERSRQDFKSRVYHMKTVAILEKYKHLGMSDFKTNLNKYPILMQLKKYSKHKFAQRMLHFAKHYILREIDIKRIKWFLQNVDSFYDRKWLLNLYIKAMTTGISLKRNNLSLAKYYIDVSQYIRRNHYITPKQLASIQKGWQLNKKNAIKVILKYESVIPSFL